MGRIGVILAIMKQVIRGANVTIIKTQIGGGEVVTAPLLTVAGDDSPPLPGDDVIIVELPSRGTYIAVGSIDHDNEQAAGNGERRIYARDSSGARVAQIWIKSSGEVTVENNNGSVLLEASGDVVANGATIDTSGNIDTAGDVTCGNIICTEATINGIAFTTHTHTVTTAPGVTGVPI